MQPWVRRSITIALVLAVIITGLSILNNHNVNNGEPQPVIKEVKALTLELNGNTNSAIETVGNVRPEAKIDVVAMAGGTVRSLNFQVGDKVGINQSLAYISSPETSINLLNSETYYANQQSNLAATKIITGQNTRQAELGLQAAEEAVRTAEIGLKTAEENLANALALRDKSNSDTKNNAVITYDTYLNTIDSALDQVDFLIGAEKDTDQLANIEPVLGVENLSTLNIAKLSYFTARSAYDNLATFMISVENIENAFAIMTDGLALTKILLDDIITLLDNTISSADFSETDLSTQITAFLTLRSSIITTLSGAEATYQGLLSLDLIKNQEIDVLENAVAAAEKQLNTARTGYLSALTTLDMTRENNDIQITGAETALNSARTQLNLMRTQAGDLNIKAPINGTITGRFVEIGTEVSPGMRIAELSQVDMVIIDIELTTEDAGEIAVGQTAVIDPENKALQATVSRIFPAADPVTKKVKVEIVYNNEGGELISESFVNISIAIDNSISYKYGQLFIPLKALTIAATENYVFTIEGSKAVKTTVEIGEIEGELVEIISGLSDGDILIIEGGKNLEDEEEVKVISLAK